jgi:hypothetical protein
VRALEWVFFRFFTAEIGTLILSGPNNKEMLDKSKKNICRE